MAWIWFLLAESDLFQQVIETETKNTFHSQEIT